MKTSLRISLSPKYHNCSWAVYSLGRIETNKTQPLRNIEWFNASVSQMWVASIFCGVRNTLQMFTKERGNTSFLDRCEVARQLLHIRCGANDVRVLDKG